MRNSIWIYGAALGIAALILYMIELYFSTNLLPTEVYIGTLVLLLIGSGIWVGKKLTAISTIEKKEKPFKRNERAVKLLNFTEKDLAVLEEVAKGRSDQEIADTLSISVNTVKAHLSDLYPKLEVTRRSTAAKKAKSLNLVP
ncbi:MAG: LuxR C-terminal-related transcriptional regulator [Gracilimonas sp.]